MRQQLHESSLGNIPDVKTVVNMLSDIEFLKLNKVKFVMDRGFDSKANINEFFRKHYKFIIAVKTSLKFVNTKLHEVRTTMITRSNHSSKYGLYYNSFLIDWDYSETKRRSGETIKDTRRLYLHIYYNDQHATDDKIAFNKLLDILEEELISEKKPGT